MSEFQEDDKLGRAFDWVQIRRLLRFTKPHRGVFLLTIFSLLAIFCLELLGPYLIRRGIDGPATAVAQGAPIEQQTDALYRIVAIFACVAVGLASLRYLQVIWMSRAGQRVVYDIRNALFTHLQKLSLRFYDRNPVGRLVTRIGSDVENLAELFTSGVVIFLFDTLRVVGTVTVLFFVNAQLASIILLFSPVLILGAFWFQKRARDAYRLVRGHLARMNAYLQEVLGGIRVIQAFRQEEKVARKYGAINDDYLDANMRSVFFFAILFPAMDLLIYGALSAVFIYGGLAIVDKTLTIGEFFQFWFYLQLLFEPLRELGEKYNILQSAMASSERIFRILDTEPEVVAPAKPRALERARGEIEFRNVSFSYDGKTPVLKNVSFHVAPGQKIALVGATGAGKTSVLSLLMRFYDPDAGSILLDGVDLREYEPGTLRSQVGFVPQDVFLFAGNIEGNISLDRPGIDHAKVEETVRLVQAEPFIARRAGGYAAAVAERGVTFSMGERQLLAFARALAGDPPIVVLDEATANVDTETEHKIQEATHELLHKRTGIIAAHRLSTVSECDRILVFHRGELREQGSHRELLQHNGIYARLYRLQFAE